MSILILKIDVLLPVHKPDLNFYSSLISLVNQKQDGFELSILVLHNGPKNCINVEEFCDNFDAVRYFYFKEPSLVNALNFGIDFSNADYIGRMDADDISHPTRFYTLLNYMLSEELDICGSDINLIVNNHHLVRQYPYSHYDIINHLAVGSPFCHPSVLFKSSLLKKLKYNDVYLAEDLDLWYRASLLPIKFGNVPSVLLNYRVHSNQLSNNPKMLEVQLRIAERSKFVLTPSTPLSSILDAFKLSKIGFLKAFFYIIYYHKSPKLYFYIIYVKIRSFLYNLIY